MIRGVYPPSNIGAILPTSGRSKGGPGGRPRVCMRQNICGWQVKLCDLSLTCAISDRFRDELSYYVLFTITLILTTASRVS